jgi:putative FmdB family regulatory protein
MPTYDYQCKLCDFTFELNLPIARRHEPRAQTCSKCKKPECIDLVIGSPRIGDPVHLGIRRPEKGFLENLKRIENQFSKPAGTTLGNRYI